MATYADKDNNVYHVDEDKGDYINLKTLKTSSLNDVPIGGIFQITPRFFRGCKVELVSEPMPCSQELMPLRNADDLVEFGGRLCYMSFEKKRPAKEGKTVNQTYLQHIREVKHGSVTEHAVFSFDVRDVSRNCTHELVRHRVGTSFSQLSSRYVDQWLPTSKYTPGVYQPIGIAAEDMLPMVMECIDGYYKLLYSGLREGKDIKDARSIARHFIPGSAGTRLLLSMNARALDHFFRLRGTRFADPEIRGLACALHAKVKHYNLFQHWHNEDEFLVEREV